MYRDEVVGVAVGEADSSVPGRGARGANPGGGGTQPQLRPSTRLVERPGRRAETPTGLESDEPRLESPEEVQPGLDSVSPWSDSRSGLSDRRLCGNRDQLRHGKCRVTPLPSCRAPQILPVWFVGSWSELHPLTESHGFGSQGSRIGSSEFFSGLKPISSDPGIPASQFRAHHCPPILSTSGPLGI